MTDAHPFHVLLPEQSPTLRRRALKLTQNRHRADDLVQTTLLKAWARRDSYKPQTNLRAWLFTILRNTFYSDLRKYRREVQDVDGIRAAALYEEPRQDHALALKELMAAVDLLPAEQRRALILMGAYGYSQLEAADACGCTVGTIKSRVSRGRHALCEAVAYDQAEPRSIPRGMSRGLNRGNAGPMARAGVASAGGAGARPGPAATRRAPQTALDMRRDASGALRPMFDVADLLHAARVPVLRACKLDDLRDLVAQLEAVCEKADLAAALKSGVAGNDRAAPHHDALSLARAELDRREASRPARAAISFGENSHLAATQHASWGWAFRPQPASLTAGSQGRAQPGGSD